MTLEPAKGSLGVYGIDGTVNDFVDAQGIGEYLEATTRYASLLAVFCGRIAATVDFDRVEPREFWRRAVREALAESNYDANPLIDAMFDAEGFDAGGVSGADHWEIVTAHIECLTEMIRRESSAELLAVAAVMLAVSLGFSPDEAMR